MKSSRHSSFVPVNSGSAPSRRRFLAGSAATVVGLAGFPAILQSQSPNSKLNVALVGVGGRGRSHVDSVGKSETIVGLCDVNATNLESAKKTAPGAKTFRDFREMFASLKDYDAVVVATTEHTHAFATLPALRAGKHVYSEKPLTRDVYECRRIIETARQAKVVTQMGTQIHSGENYRRVVELIQGGAIGAVREAHVWVSRAWGWHASEEESKQHKDIVFVQNRPTETMPVPANLDWDLWIGPAPFRPYHEVYFPGPKWYRWWDFGNGTMSDLGSHWNDLPFWALNLDSPLTIEAGGPPPHPEIAPASMTAKYTYGARGNMPPVSLTWHQGTKRPEIWEKGGIPQWPNGVLFIGDEGMLLADYGKLMLLPEEKFATFDRPRPSIPPSPGQMEEFLLAIKNGGQPLCHFDYSGPLTEANHLGNVAYRAGKKLEWDSKNLKFPNAPDAEKYLRREYRDGWSLDA